MFDGFLNWSRLSREPELCHTLPWVLSRTRQWLEWQCHELRHESGSCADRCRALQVHGMLYSPCVVTMLVSVVFGRITES